MFSINLVITMILAKGLQTLYAFLDRKINKLVLNILNLDSIKQFFEIY